MNNPEWIKDLFNSIDEMNSEKFVSFFAEDGAFVFGNNPAANGKENVYQMVDGFFKSIKAISHKDLRTWQDQDRVITEGNVTYTRHDDTQLSVDFCNVFTMIGDKVQNYRIYIDNSELYN